MYTAQLKETLFSILDAQNKESISINLISLLFPITGVVKVMVTISYSTAVNFTAERSDAEAIKDAFLMCFSANICRKALN